MYMMYDSSDISQTIDQRVQRVVEEALTDESMFIVDLTVRGVKGSRVVEVFLDSDNGLGIDTLATLNREIGFLLETEEIIEGKYTLNVSSPGLDRPLTLPRQYKKNKGRSLKVKYKTEDGHSLLKGELLDSDEAFIEVKSSSGEVQRIPMEDVIESKIILPW